MMPMNRRCSRCGQSYVTGDSFTPEEAVYCEGCRPNKSRGSQCVHDWLHIPGEMGNYRCTICKNRGCLDIDGEVKVSNLDYGDDI